MKQQQKNKGTSTNKANNGINMKCKTLNKALSKRLEWLTK